MESYLILFYQSAGASLPLTIQSGNPSYFLSPLKNDLLKRQNLYCLAFYQSFMKGSLLIDKNLHGLEILNGNKRQEDIEWQIYSCFIHRSSFSLDFLLLQPVGPKSHDFVFFTSHNFAQIGHFFLKYLRPLAYWRIISKAG